MDALDIQSDLLTVAIRKTGGRHHTANLHSKQPSGIARRLRAAGVDWVADLAQAIKADNIPRINTWLKLLPYLVVSNSFRTKPKRWRGASKAALIALENMEGR